MCGWVVDEAGNMKTVLFTVPFILIASATLAEARPNSLAMSCASTRGLVQNTGAIVIGTGPNLYDRFVMDAGYCTLTQKAEPAWIATADEPECLVGRRCVERRIRRR
jgi:hypothetical protein